MGYFHHSKNELFQSVPVPPLRFIHAIPKLLFVSIDLPFLNISYQCTCMCTQLLSHFWLFKSPWTIACQVPLSMEFPRQKYWIGLSFPPPGDLPNPEIEPESLCLLRWQVDSLALYHMGSSCFISMKSYIRLLYLSVRKTILRWTHVVVCFTILFCCSQIVFHYVDILSSVQSLSHYQTFCDPMDCSRPGLPVHLSITNSWVYSNLHPLSLWCHPIISPSVIPFSSGFQSFPALGSFQMSQFFITCGQSIGVST